MLRAVIRELHKYEKRIGSLEEARKIPYVGEKTAMKVVYVPWAVLFCAEAFYAKIMEIVRTGKLRRVDHERTDEVQALMKFQGIYGVGESHVCGA